MSLSDCRYELIRRNDGIRTIPEEGTVLYSSATIFRGMIDAYLSDGNGFLAGNDVVNAYASYWYALGWMDAGVFLGLISAPGPGRHQDFSGSTLTGPDTGRLQEKTTRYRSLLLDARASLDASPETGSSLFSAAENMQGVATSYYHQGTVLEDQGTLAGALGAYSYGFAWLDAGVRFGLFRIKKNRELFTI
jgi:hypothetical protein